MSCEIKFHIPDMSCNHCVNTLTNAIQQILPNAKVTIELAQRELTVTGTDNSQQIIQLISEAGFTPQAL